MPSSPSKQGSTARSEPIEQRFRRLVELWKQETAFLSDAGKIMNHPAYREIVGLGDGVVPLLLGELENQPSLLVWALPETTGADPVPLADRGNIRKMTDAWLAWGRKSNPR